MNSPVTRVRETGMSKTLDVAAARVALEAGA